MGDFGRGVWVYERIFCRISRGMVRRVDLDFGGGTAGGMVGAALVGVSAAGTMGAGTSRVGALRVDGTALLICTLTIALERTSSIPRRNHPWIETILGRHILNWKSHGLIACQSVSWNIKALE